LVADFDARDGAWKFGMASTPQWLSFHCGLAHRTAVEHLRVARALAAFPNMAEAMAAGRLSYSQARAIARVAKPGETRLVDDLLEVARHGTIAHLEVMVRGLRTVDHNENPVPQAEREHVAGRWGEDSMWALSARLDPSAAPWSTPPSPNSPLLKTSPRPTRWCGWPRSAWPRSPTA
jgi:hypothetical protein